MTLIREANTCWQVEQPTPFDAPLSAGLKFVVNAQTAKQQKDVTCELKDWYYRVDGPDTGELELVVQEIKQSWIDDKFSRLSNDAQFMVGGAIPVIVTLLLVALAFLAYKQPDHTGQWAFMGRNVRWVVGWGLVVVFGMVLPWRLRLLLGPPKFSHMFFSFLFSLTGLILAIVWLVQVAPYPENFAGTEAAYAAFAQSLAAKFRMSYWPYILAALPWIALGFKTLGLTLAQGATETFAKSRKGGG